jgi:Leucine-rich repeat (LRR) protein
MSGEEEVSSRVLLTGDQVSKGLKTLGIHPLALRHSFLELSLPGLKIQDISILSQYPLVMYLDINDNQVETLASLEHLTALVTLKARNNKLVSCLDFSPPLCNEENAWSEGRQAVGSMLTLADLRDNYILEIGDLSAHQFMECLLLANNQIKQIKGLQNLKYLQV